MEKSQGRAHCKRAAVPNKAYLSLAARECVTRMCLDSENTMNILFNVDLEGRHLHSISDDSVRDVALSVLRKIFCNLKTDICRIDQRQNLEMPSSVLQFLRDDYDQNLSETLQRYVNENDMKTGRTLLKSTRRTKSWREINILSAMDRSRLFRRPVPANVPPLDPIQVAECLDAPTPLRSARNQSTKLSGESRLKGSSNESCSSDDSKSSDNEVDAMENLTKLSQQLANDDVVQSSKDVNSVISFKRKIALSSLIQNSNNNIESIQAHQFADKNCGTTPRELPMTNLNKISFQPGITSAYLEQALLKFFKDVPISSTLTKRVDVGTDTEDFLRGEFQCQGDHRNDSLCFATQNSLQIIERSSNSSAIITTNSVTNSSSQSFPSSELSVGQIPLRKALFTESSQHNLVPVNVDGSVEKHLRNYYDQADTSYRKRQLFLPHSYRHDYISNHPIPFTSINNSKIINEGRKADAGTKFGVEKLSINSYECNSSSVCEDITNFSSHAANCDSCCYGISLRNDGSSESELALKMEGGPSPSSYLDMSKNLFCSSSGKTSSVNPSFSISTFAYNRPSFMAREVSLLTSFDSSNTATTKHITANNDSIPRQVIEPRLVEYFNLNGELNKAILNKDSLFFSGKSNEILGETEEKIIDATKSRSLSSSSTKHSPVIKSHSSKRQSFFSRLDEEEESTLNQISPLPTTG